MKNTILNVFNKSKPNGEKVMSTKRSLYFNSEGYPDPTAFHGINNIIKEEQQMERQVSDLVHVFKVICSLSGFEIIGRIQFRHKKSGKEFK